MVYLPVTLLDGLPVPAATINAMSSELGTLSANSNSAWQSYAIAVTANSGGFALGNGTLTGQYRTVTSDLIIVRGRLIWGSTTTAGTGFWRITVPVAASTDSINMSVGNAWFLDTGSQVRNGNCHFIDADEIGLDSPTGSAGSGVPQTWSTGDEWRFTLEYEPV